jgi:uncharacterized protein (UPF0212 family)
VRELSASEILDVWERGRGRTLAERAVELLAAGGHPAPPDEVPVGKRDALLAELRERTFGPSLEAVVSCPSCGGLVEAGFTVADLGVGLDPSDGQELELEVDRNHLRLRLPTAADLVAVADAPDPDQGRGVLLERCLLEGEPGPGVGEAASAAMAEADPAAWIELELGCPACGERWSAPFDIVSFLWAEVEARVRELVRDVHALASAYGWREDEVLALTAERRQAYLELVAG